MLAAGLCSSAYGAPLPGFALVAHSEHFAVYAREDRPLPVDVGKSERFLRDAAARLGVQVEGTTEYYRHEYPEQVAVHGGVWAIGVAQPRDSRIHSTLGFHPHEIVHIVAARLGDPGRFFQEGLAVHIGDRGRLGGQSVQDLARRHLRRVRTSDVVSSFDRVDPEAAYPIAGAFVSHLVTVHGLDKVAAFWRACGSGPQNRDAAFARVFGESLDRALTAWTESLA